MTYEEAEKVIYEMICLNLLTPKEDEALHIAYQAVKKQIPEKPVFEKDLYGGHLYCPSCKKVIMSTIFNYQSSYCNCGQALDWSDEK